MKNNNLIFDFDSTLIQLETIEILADYALCNNKYKEDILGKIKEITSKAMLGEMPFSDAINKRISLLNIKKEDIESTIKHLQNKLTPSFKENLFNFQKNIKNNYIISGGFKEIIVPILEPFGFIENNIFANSFIKDKSGDVLSIDQKNPLSKDNGKNIVTNNLQGEHIIIGDGYTDYQLKKLNNVKKFILFTENIHRKELSLKADCIAKNFTEVFNFIENEK